MMSILRVRRISCLFSLFSISLRMFYFPADNPLINSGISKSPGLVTFTLAQYCFSTCIPVTKVHLHKLCISCQQSDIKCHQFHQFTSALFTMCIILVLLPDQSRLIGNGLVYCYRGRRRDGNESFKLFALQYPFHLYMINSQSKQSVSMHNHSTELDSFFQGCHEFRCRCVGVCGKREGVRRNEIYIYRFPPVVHTNRYHQLS